MESHPVRLDTSATDELLKKTAGSSPITFVGLPGSTETANHIRLYQDSELVSFVEIPEEAVLDSQQAPNGGPALVRCRRDTQIRVGAVATVNADLVFTRVEPPLPPEMQTLEDRPPSTPRLPAPQPPTTCHMYVYWRPYFRRVMGPDGEIVIPMSLPVFVLDCR